jgi:hypothetical protein
MYPYQFKSSKLPSFLKVILKGPNSKKLVKSVLRGHLCDKVKVVFYDRWSLNRGSIHMKFSMIGQDKGDLLIQVTA